MSPFAKALLSPRSIALVGASGDPKKNTARPQRYLRKHGYQGDLFPINPNRDEVLGEPAYPTLKAVPQALDHVFVMVPAPAVKQVIVDCAELAVSVVTVFSDGFAEAGEEGVQRQQEILAIAKDAGVRLLGPNSIGLINVTDRTALSVNATLELPELLPGNVSMVSQSGSLIGTLLSRGQARGMGFAKLVSVGNEADLSVGEIIDTLVDDPATDTILLFLEAIRDAECFAAAARRAFAVGKPIIAYKLGRSVAGQQLAVSHTGAIAGDDAVSDAFLRHHGVLRVDMLETLLELPALLGQHGPVQNKQKRVAVLTTTGGGAALVVDRLGSAGIELASPPEQLRNRLAGFGLSVGDSPMIDLTLAGTKKEVYSAALEELLVSSDCDAVIAVVGSSGHFYPELAVQPIVEVGHGRKPLAAFIVPQGDRSLALLQQAGVAAFRTPEACADGMRAYLQWGEPGKMEAAKIPPNPGRPAPPLIKGGDMLLNEYEACQIFADLGVTVASSQCISGLEEDIKLDYPLAAKVLSADLAHKTDAGGILLNIGNDTELRDAYQRIMVNIRQYDSTAKVKGVLLQEMQQGLAEVLIGYRQTTLGPVVMLGMGGLLAEIYDDFVLRMAPIDKLTALAMIEEVRGLAIIRGYRGQALGDCNALAEAVCALSQLSQWPEVEEAEINPLLVKVEGQGVVAVDGLIKLNERLL